MAGRIPVRRVVVVVAVVGAAWLAIGAWQIVDAVADLRSARDSGGDLQSLEPGADLERAQSDLSAAREKLESAAGRLRGLAVAPYRLLPSVGDSISVAAELATAGALAAQAGETVVAAINALPEGVDSLAPAGGAVPVARISELSDPLQQADALLVRSLTHLARTQGHDVPAPLDDARRALGDTLPQISDGAHRAAALASQLPAFLGAQQPRRYLFLAQNPAEARGTGGFIGAFAILTADNGRLSFSEFNEIQTLPAYHVSEVIAPSAEFARRYNRYGGAGFWHNINMTPDFPTAARAMLALYAKGVGQQLDGVIATDPFAMQELIAVAGPVEVPGFGTVAADDVIDVVSNRAHAEIEDSEQRKGLLGAVAVGAFDGLLEGSDDPVAALAALADAAAGGHIVLRSVDPQVQAAFLRADIAGALPDPPGDFLAVIGNSESATKLDYYMRRTIRLDVVLNTDGSTDSTMTVRLDNAAPSGGISHRVIGPNAEGLEPGEQKLLLSTYAAQGAQLAVAAGGQTAVREEVELGHAVFTTGVTVPPKGSHRLSLSWTRPDGWQRQPDGGRYQLTIAGQTTLRPTAVTVTVTLPDGMRLAQVPDAVNDLGRGRVRLGGTLERRLVLDLALVHPGG